MTSAHDELRYDLLAALRANRDLPDDYDGELVETLVDRIAEHARQEVRLAPNPNKKSEIGLRGAEVVTALLSGTFGWVGVAYLVQQFQALAALDTNDVTYGTVQGAMDAAHPMLVLLTMLLGALMVGALVHALLNLKAGLLLLTAATLALAACVTLALSQSGPYLATLLFTRYLSPVLLPVLAVLAVVLALSSSIVGVTRVMRNPNRRGRHEFTGLE